MGEEEEEEKDKEEARQGQLGGNEPRTRLSMSFEVVCDVFVPPFATIV